MQRRLSFTGSIASFSFRHRWWVLATWLVILVAAMGASSGLGKVLTTEQRDLSGSESANAQDLFKARFPKQPLTETLIMRSETDTVDNAAFQQTTGALLARLLETPGVTGVQSWQDTGDPTMVSKDRHAALAIVTLSPELKEAEKHADELLAAVAGAARPQGYSLHIIGTATSNHELNKITEEDLARGEGIGVSVALVVIVLAFGALVAASAPLLLGFAAILPALGTAALIGRTFELSFFVTNIITMIGLAVGIDYSLFIIGRYREEIAKGRTLPRALEIAAETSGRAVFFSGITVLLALSGMLFVRSNVFISIGLGAMVVVVWAIFASLTLLPALLSLFGHKINALRLPLIGKAGYGQRFWGVMTQAVQHRPALFAIGSTALLLAAAAPLLSIKLGSNGPESLPKETNAYQAIQALERDFNGGRFSPMTVVVDGDIASPPIQNAISGLRSAVEAGGQLQWLAVVPAPDGRTALLKLAAPSLGTGDESLRLVTQLREQLVPQAFVNSGARTYVGGDLAIYKDVKAEMDGKLPVVFAFVLGLSFVLLLLVFRSVAIPAKAIVMNLLSVGAAYGLVVAVFQHGFLADQLGFTRTPQVEFWIPLFLFSILFGLSMDYHVFLLSRVKEEYGRHGNNRAAVSEGVKSTAGMITSAAVIMVAVFAGFALGRDAGLQQVGFGLAVAVFMDATIIRSVLVPASMQLLGHYNWWFPRWLEWLPALHIEGHIEEAPAATPEPAHVPAPAYASGFDAAAGD